RNALVAYALFQDWGNDPLKYDSGEPRRLLNTIAQLFPEGAAQGPAPVAASSIDRLLGLDAARRPQPRIDGRYDTPGGPLSWHYTVPGPQHLTVALDNRTRRSYASRNGPPGNISNGPQDNPAAGAQARQIPAAPLGEGREVLLVVAPLQVLAPSIFDEIVAPASYRAFDAFSHAASAENGEGSDLMVGTNPDAIEGWALDPPTFEALLQRLAAHRQVVLLSGDVHYSAATQMSYWRRGDSLPARLVQFTSSGFKNVMPDYLITVDHSLAFAQAMVRADIGAERMGWLSAPPAGTFIYPPGQSDQDLPLVLRKRLHQSPALLPTYGWPRKDATPTRVHAAHAPDWSWRLLPVFDLRPDDKRPPMARPLPLVSADIERQLQPAGGDPVLGYQAIAARHQRQLERVGNSRQILFRANLGVLSFECQAGVLMAVQTLYTLFPDPQAPATETPKPLPYVVQRAALTPDPSDQPPHQHDLHGGLAASLF
ncbi:MAG: hypothetical protein RJA98_1168, partial [Pseudomonadota bacterium]